MPPGLATRSGLSEDVLRVPQYSATVHTPTRERREMWVHAAQRASGGKQAGGHRRGPSSTRPETPAEQPNTGVYHSGTLRITNGAASPEPSIISKLAATSDLNDGDNLASLESSADANLGHCIQQSERPRPGGPRLPQRKSRAVEKAEVEADERQRSQSASKPNSERRRFSFDQVVSLPTSISPSAPRFQQRWSHRAVHLSQQYMSDCEIGESPFDERSAQLELAKRLSSVRDIEDDDESQFLDPHADAMFKLTGDSIPAANADNDGNEAHPMPVDEEVEHGTDNAELEPPSRPLRKVDSGYGSDIPTSPQRQQALRSAANQDPALLPAAETETPAPREDNSHTSSERPSLQRDSSMYTFKEILGTPQPQPQMESPLADVHAKRSSPLSFFKAKKKNPNKSSSVTLADETASRPALVHSKSSPSCSGSLDAASQPKRLQKRVPESVRRQRQIEAEKRSAIEDGKESNVAKESATMTTETLFAESRIQLASDENTQIADQDNKDESTPRFRLRGKSFGRKRSKTNASEHNAETVLHTPAFRTRTRRSTSISVSTICPDSKGQTGSSCMGSSSQMQQSPDQLSPNFQTVAHALTSHPPYTSTEFNRSISVPKSVQDRHHAGQESTQISHTPSPVTQNPAQGLPQDVPMPSAPPRSGLEGAQRVIPIGAHGSVEDLFPDWQSRPASTPSPAPTPSPTYLQVRQSYKPRGLLSVSSIPPLPELPADIESKVSRADQMVAKKMMNSPRNSARNSPMPSTRNSEDSPSSMTRRSATKPPASPSDVEDATLENNYHPVRWSVDGSIPLPQAAERSKPASPTHDSQHPGWPGWEKQADLWRQRKIGLGHALKKSVDMAAKIPVETEASPPSPSIVISRYITPLGEDMSHNAQSRTEKNSTAEKLAQAYTYLLDDDKENWGAQQNVQRTDSVDSTATYDTTSSKGRTAKADVSRTGSAHSVASSNTSTGGSGASMSPLAEKSATYASNQAFTPYRPADAVQAERSRALSLARCSCHIPAGSLDLSEVQNALLPQSKSATVLDRYSGGLGYGWDRSTGFGGSAGTRSSGTENVNRKSVKISEDFGLDLSDIPVFLRKAQVS